MPSFSLARLAELLGCEMAGDAGASITGSRAILLSRSERKLVNRSRVFGLGRHQRCFLFVPPVWSAVVETRLVLITHRCCRSGNETNRQANHNKPDYS